MQNELKKYYPQLDAIRGISFLAVFIYHTIIPGKAVTFFEKFIFSFYENLAMSIDVFFVLSSFLLTLLGIAEYQKKGAFSFKNYFIRRVLRIWPLYYLLMFVTFVIIKFVSNKYGMPITLPNANWYLFFVSNYCNQPHVFFLIVLWTLSVEEQFYFIWGFCLYFFQKRLKLVILFLLILSLLYIFYGAFYKLPILTHTLTYLVDMMIGGFIAYSIVYPNKLYRYIEKLNEKKSLLFYFGLPILLIVHFFLRDTSNILYSRFLDEVIRLLFICYTGFVILHQMLKENSFLSLKKSKFLIYTGKISFGLYCFHGFVILFVGLLFSKLNMFIITKSCLLLLVTFIIASTSYYFIEKPFLKLKEKVR